MYHGRKRECFLISYVTLVRALGTFFGIYSHFYLQKESFSPRCLFLSSWYQKTVRKALQLRYCLIGKLVMDVTERSFQLSVEINSVFFVFALLRFVISLKKSSSHFLNSQNTNLPIPRFNKSDLKPKPIMSCAVSRLVWRRLPVFASSSDWFIDFLRLL